MDPPPRPPVEPITPQGVEQPTHETGESSNTRRATVNSSGSESSGRSSDMEEDDERRASTQQLPRVAHNEPEQDPVDKELQELEAWREKTAKLQRITQLRQAQARYIAGDQTALRTVLEGAPSHSSVLNVPTAKLPTPKAPHTFAKRTRLEFNC